MFEIEFYEKRDGTSDIWDFLEDLRLKSDTNKDARIQYNQLGMYIGLLEKNGTSMNENFTKHLGDGIWELRPGNNRVFYFCFSGEKIVLLHHFRKKTQKTPVRELERAKAERSDYLERFGGK